MTTAPSRRRVAVPTGRLARQPWPTPDVRRQQVAAPAATTGAAHRALRDDATRLAALVRGLHHGTATLRRPDLLDARLRRLCADAGPLTGDARLLDDVRAASGAAVHALQSRPLALATPADFVRLERLAELLASLAALTAGCGPGTTRRRDDVRTGGWRARRQARVDRALFG